MTTRQIKELIQALEEGKEIQYRFKDKSDKEEWKPLPWNCDATTWHFDVFEYRIKPQLKYIPYRTPSEFLNAQKKHGPYLMYMSDTYTLPIAVNLLGIFVPIKSSGTERIDWQYLYDHFKWQDGHTCGIIEI